MIKLFGFLLKLFSGIESSLIDLGLDDVNIIEFHGVSAFAQWLRGHRLRFHKNFDVGFDSWRAEASLQTSPLKV